MFCFGFSPLHACFPPRMASWSSPLTPNFNPTLKTELQCHLLPKTFPEPSSQDQCMKVKGESEVTQSCPTLSDPMDWSLPGSSIHGILQARVLEWAAISFSRGIFLTQGSNPGLLHCRQTLYCLSHQGSPKLNAAVGDSGA